MRYVQSFLKGLLGALREVFDENAYQRFLLRTGQTASVKSYREFLHETETTAATRPRCC